MSFMQKTTFSKRVLSPFSHDAPIEKGSLFSFSMRLRKQKGTADCRFPFWIDLVVSEEDA